MTTTASSSESRLFQLSPILIYAAMAPLVLWDPAYGATLATPVELRRPQHFVLSDGSPLKSVCLDTPCSVSEIIESIETQLGLSRSALADLLGVTRPTLYAWMGGTVMRPRNAKRVARLKEAASLLTQSAGGPLPALWQYQTLPSGQSFADGMRAGASPCELAKMLADQWQYQAADAALLATIFGD
jgi:transcriptional regulator with XRE-family HTH domain